MKAQREPSKRKASPVLPSPQVETSSHSEEHVTCAIIAVGASAGGLEAFQELLQNLPNDTGAAFVFIQHLDPKHVSLLSDILSKSTSMPLVQVTDGMEIEPNHVYVIPPNVGMRLVGSQFRLTERPSGRPHMPIDEFFRSLADQEGSSAIGVLLSGNAPDGTLGLKAISAVGGITVAQDQTAKFDAMPRNAVSAGWVDLVLPPARIASEIARLCLHPYVNGRSGLHGPAPDRTDKVEGERFLEIFNLLRAATGVDFTHYKHGTLRRRILRRMVLSRIESEEQYARRLKEDRAELKALFHDILISVTGFFRENATFDALKKHVFPQIFQNRSQDDAVRVWVPGCSTGEEAYSVAMSLLEYMRDENLECPVQIFGTDLSEPALERARAGIYPESISADVAPGRLRRFFVKVDGQYQISRSVRDLCIFAQQNLTKDPPFSKLDLITCRNVLIYLGSTLQNKVMRFLHYALKPSGFLVLGLSETVGPAADLYVPIDRRLRIYTRKSATATISPLEFGSYDTSRMEPSGDEANAPSAHDLQRRVDQFLLNRYSPAGVLIDEELRILQFHGHTSPYLEHGAGEPILSLNRMLRTELAVEFRRVFDRTRRKQRATRGELVTLPYMDKIHKVRISITPMLLAGASGNRYLVLFEEFPTAEPKEPPKKLAQGSKLTKSGDRLRELEDELAATRQYLESVIEEQQATTEELKSANEEVQSSNEELQSTNEELLTAKEELQSTNEELTTVNEEMQSRNTELSHINNDLNNLLSSVNIPIVMVGIDLRIRRFTPQAERVLNLLPTDVGRPIGDFKPKIDIPNLDQILMDVIESLRVREREVQDRDGHWFSMWVRPYRTIDNKIDGAVMVLFDVTERKQAAESRYRRLFEAARDGIIIVDGETGEIIDLNPYLAKNFGVSRSASIGVHYWDLDVFRGTEMNSATFAELQESEFVQRSLTISSKTGGRFDVEVIGNLYLEGEDRVVQLNIRDVTDRRRGVEMTNRAPEEKQPALRFEVMTRVAGSLAHEFNNLVTTIAGYSEMLHQRVEPGSPLAADFERLMRAVDRAGHLTRQLLAFGRRLSLEPEVIDLNKLIEQMRPVVRTTIPSRVELSVDLAGGLKPARADRGRLEDALLNLVANVRDTMGSSGRLRITTSNQTVDSEYTKLHPAVPAGDYVVLEVSYSGSFIEGETQAGLLEPFFGSRGRGDDGSRTLPAVQAAVKQSGGHVWAASELGRGSTFRIFLPQAAAPGTAENGDLPRGTETILIAIDDEPVRELMARVVREWGYTVVEASAEEALEQIRQEANKFDLLIADLVMHRINGRDLAERFLELRPDAGTLLLLGQGEDSLAGESVIEDLSVFLQKPFTPASLARRIREILKGL
jgi:two-component system CheB/CheR fusion protein